MAGGVALAPRGRGGRHGAPDAMAAAGVAVAERPTPAGRAGDRSPGARRRGRRPRRRPRRRGSRPEPEPEPASYRGRLGKARGLLSGYIGAVRAQGKIDAATWDDLEEALIRADVGVGATDALLDDLRARVSPARSPVPTPWSTPSRPTWWPCCTTGTSGLRRRSAPTGRRRPSGEPTRTVDVWLFVGVNGVGKTTTVGKVATRLSRAGTTVLLAAGDTFRAAARGAAEPVGRALRGRHRPRAPRGATRARWCSTPCSGPRPRATPLVLADTAGRLHNKVNLIEELKKIRRVSDRPPGHVAEVLLVLDATTGQNGLAQAKVFLDAVDVSGVVLTKLDGTAKGGIVVAIQRELGLPVKLVGLGEGADDLVDFDAAAFVDALF